MNDGDEFKGTPEQLADPKMKECIERSNILRKMMNKGNLDEAIAFDAEKIRGISPTTPFHTVLEKNFLHQVNESADWLIECYDHAAETMKITALYVEMCGFDFNFDEWSACVCAYDIPFEKMKEDLYNALGEYEYMHEPELVLTGMEDLQKAMEEYEELQNREPAEKIPQHLTDSHDLAFGLILLHMQDLITRAHAETARRGHPVGKVYVLSCVHDMSGWEFISAPRLRAQM